MDCAAFHDWLDRSDAVRAETADPERAVAETHAAECADCAAALRAQRDLEHALAQRFTAAPAGFTDRVMARLPARAGAVRVPEDSESPWPWWIQILFEPAAALGLALGLLYAVFAPTLLASGTEAVPALLTRLEPLGRLPVVPWLHGPMWTIAFVAGLCVGIVGLFRGSALLFDRLTRLRAR